VGGKVVERQHPGCTGPLARMLKVQYWRPLIVFRYTSRAPRTDPSGFGALCALGKAARTAQTLPERLSRHGKHADTGDPAPSASRHADLIVDSDVLKNTVFIKTVEVSSGAPLRDAPRDAPCDAPRDTAFHFTMQRTVQAPYPKTFAPLPGYLPTRRPRTRASSRKAAWAAPVPARCISQCISQSIVNMCVQ